ncbi:MAG: Holliday junction branch migration protein RuvA [Patescibacteria group bacterium]
MIAYLRGTIQMKRDQWVILETGGVGYQVSLPERVLSTMPLGSQREIYVHHHITENSQGLYGFVTVDEMEFFQLLLTISGIGPKVGLGVMNAASVSEIKAAVVEGNSDILTAVSGIGAKTAQRIVLELKSKIKMSDVRDIGTSSLDVGNHFDAFQALMQLGYNAVEARAALKMVPITVTDPQEKVKLALKNLR